MKKLLIIAIGLTQILIASENIEYTNNILSEVKEVVEPIEVKEVVEPIEVKDVVVPVEIKEIATPTEVKEVVEPTETKEVVEPTETKEVSSNESKIIKGFIEDPLEGMDNKITYFSITKKTKGSNFEDITIKKESFTVEDALDNYKKMVLDSDLIKEKYGKIEIIIETPQKIRNITSIGIMYSIKSTQITHKKNKN